MDSLYIAVDLGAGSGRVFLCGVAPGELLLEEVRRFHYPPIEADGHLRWDFARIFGEIKTGLRAAGKRARELNRRIRSIGVDSWAVDYGLLDAAGELIENPICYRDDRTRTAMRAVFEQIPSREIYNRTGIQFLNFNTIFQLFAHRQSGLPPIAERLLLIPDLINFCLTGRVATEYTNATTTQLANHKSQNWDKELLEKLDLPAHLLAPIVPTGTDLGSLKPEIADESSLENVSVVATATHDTASAVAGAPLAENWAYISSGTWSLVGVERDLVLINDAAAQHNFTNEGGAFDTVRFLKNVMGLWIFESCRREWQARGIVAEYDNLIGAVEQIEESQGFIFPDDARFLNPPSMLAAIAEQLRETGQTASDDPIAVTKVILDSLAFRYASVLRTIEAITEKKLNGVQIVGGGGRNRYLNQMTANASGLNTVAGLIEATVTGNVLVQAVAAKRFASLAEARRHVANNVRLETVTPQTSFKTEELWRRYAAVESRYSSS